MKKIMVLLCLIVVFMVISAAPLPVVDPVPEAHALGGEACAVAAEYGWHSTFHNLACYYEIMMDNWLL